MPGIRAIRSFNLIVIFFLFLLLMIGVLMIYSATNSMEYSAIYHNYYIKQLLWVVIGLAAMFLVSTVNYSIWVENGYFLYALTIILLVMLPLLGRSMRWFHIGPFTFQPSELSKATLLIALTRFISDSKGKMHLLEGLFKASMLIGIPMVLIVIQPDLGTALIFVPLFFCLLYVSGVRGKYLVYSIAGLVMFMPVFWYVMKDYQKKRLFSFINPEADPLGSGYSLIQSKIAIGSGGFFGKGLFKGTQSQLNFIPEHHTDFIFSVIGEELGFIFAVAILLIFYILIMEAIKIAVYAKDKSGQMLATGIVCIFVTQIFMNVGMTMGILPVVGVPLPFVSYGGSSLLFNMVLMGILLNIHSSIKKFSS
jgi:rod shape determining protein RodA